MKITAFRGVRRIDMRMCVDPYHSDFFSGQPLASRFRRACERTDANWKVSTKGENTTALASLLVNLLADPLGDCTDGKGTFHVSVYGIICRDARFVVFIFTKDSVTQIFLELRE